MRPAINLKKITQAARDLAVSSERQRNAFLTALTDEIARAQKKILAANVRDVREAKATRTAHSFVVRLELDDRGITQLTKKVDSIRRLKSGIGEVLEHSTLENGLILKKVRVPLGVLLVIYEARPEVTIDAAGLCLKSGNAAILKGGSQALRTNRALFDCVRSALRVSGLPEYAISFISSSDRSVTRNLLKRSDSIDLVIARGGYEMVKAVMAQSRIPVLAHAAGGARVFVDRSADLTLAEKILLNAKTSKPAACNSLDTILVHRDIAEKFVPQITAALTSHNVAVKKTLDWDRETLGPVVGIKIVKDADDAIRFIQKHTKLHTEGIIARDATVIEWFLRSLDAAALFVNASTRLHDGYVFGLGSEMGISTSKLHARGPVGLKELTTYRWHIYGTGQIRKE
ncbi:MAG: glutamate-5-semialdehyde dehydrogenase [Patescibacteria group bacterium]